METALSSVYDEPEMENYYIASVMLVENIGCMRAKQLLDYFMSGEAIWKADREQLEESKLNPSILDALVHFRRLHPNCPEQLAEFCSKKKIKLCSIKDIDYPELLKEIKDAPALLYYKGELSNDPKVAIVGTRHPTVYGLRTATELAMNIAGTGVVVVSGAAYGIDTAAHKGAMKVGKTIAVLGEGLEVVSPKDKKKFLDEIVENGGAVISEYSPNARSSKGTFPQRNRIITGLSIGIVVIETDVDGGAMNTAKHAGEYGRLIFAVPGSINEYKSRGCHQLIRKGATLIRNAEDILEDCKLNIDVSRPKKRVIGLPPLEGNEEIVMKAIPTDKTISEEELLIKLDDLEISEVSMILLTLEDKGYINQESFGNYIRAYGS